MVAAFGVSSSPRRRARLAGRAMLVALLCLAALLAAPSGRASAHAHLVQADPAPDSVIAHAPSTASFIFDEPLNAALTRVRITDAAGKAVTTDRGHLGSGHHGELWEMALPVLPDGTYSVYWTSESATDGHVMSSFYTFRVAASGSTDTIGAVTGAAAGVYGGGSSAGGLLSIGGGPFVTALFYWLGLIAQALWLGALLVELLVLAPTRRAATPAARLAWAATPRLWWLVRSALVVAVWALVGEVVSLAMQGTGGDWGRALAPSTLSGILSSQNGRFIVLRFVALLMALLLAGRAQAPASAEAARPRPAPRRAPQALGIAVPALAVPRWEGLRGLLILLAAVYMLLVAFSGHAADVTPGWLSYPIDWLHLLFTAAWAGGIAALAFGVLPARHTLPPDERALAVVPLLDRFSPIAYSAIAVLALSGLYNAVNHLDSPSMLSGSAYGQLLLIKIALVALMIVLSASHVFGLRTRIMRAQQRLRRDGSLAAEVHEGLATLAARLRLESGVGAAVLLATALMSQTLPYNGTAIGTGNAAGTIPSAISGDVTVGDLRGRLSVAPPAVGSTTFTLSLWERGTPVTEQSGAAIIHLYPAAQPALRANLTAQASGARFTARGGLASTGTWRADVLVRTAAVNAYRTLPFTFTVGPGATFLEAGLNPSAVSIAVAPGLISAANTFTISGVQAPAVRLLSQSLDMYMGILPYQATALGRGRWRVTGVYSPMNGHWGLTVQARKDGGWVSLRQFEYFVPLSGHMRLLTPQSAPAAPGSSPATPKPSALNKPFNVTFARTLPYTVLVTEMGSNGVRTMRGTLLRTGVQAHGVDVLDGTPYAYVTNFGADPGTVSQIDLRTMKVVRTFTVGLGPAHIVFSPDQRRAYVTDFHSSDLYEMNLVSGATRRVALDNCFEPHGIDISEDGHTLFVACAGGAWIYTVDTRTLRPGRVATTGPGAFGVAVDAPRHEVWVTNQTVNNVTVLDEKTLKTLATIPVGKGPALLVPTPDGSKVYVADQLGNQVSVIDAASRRVIATLDVAAQPHGPDVTADGKYVYVASIGGNAVTIIRTSDNKVVAIVPSAIGSNEVAIAH